jgi:F-type H+-transporting ATPase subunit b
MMMLDHRRSSLPQETGRAPRDPAAAAAQRADRRCDRIRIVFFFVWRWVWPADQDAGDAPGRPSPVRQEAEKAKAEAESLLAGLQGAARRGEVRGQPDPRGGARLGRPVRTDLIAKAEADAEQIRAKARDEASLEMSSALAMPARQVGEISVDLAGKIVGESLDQQAHQALIDRYLADLERL